MNFSNKKILRTFSSSHSKNIWANLDTIGWKKVGQDATDGVTNMGIIINAAKANNMAVSGVIDNGTNQISQLFL